MTTPTPLYPTLPYLGGAGEHQALLAGITFLEATESGRIDLAGLAQWFEDYVVGAGVLPSLPSVVIEPPAGTVALRPGVGALAQAHADLPRIITTSRLRVVDALRGLIASPSDDRFLRACIFHGRVRRDDGHWVARPEPTAPLSGIVQSLFAVAVLSDRSFYDRQMCVCDTCGRVSFDPAPSARRACATHAARASGVSQKATTPRGDAAGQHGRTRKTGTTPT